jgi:hypothetical protein
LFAKCPRLSISRPGAATNSKLPCHSQCYYHLEWSTMNELGREELFILFYTEVNDRHRNSCISVLRRFIASGDLRRPSARTDDGSNALCRIFKLTEEQWERAYGVQSYYYYNYLKCLKESILTMAENSEQHWNWINGSTETDNMDARISFVADLHDRSLHILLFEIREYPKSFRAYFELSETQWRWLHNRQSLHIYNYLKGSLHYV